MTPLPTTPAHGPRPPVHGTCLVLAGGMSLPGAVSGHLQDCGVQAPVGSSQTYVPACQEPRERGRVKSAPVPIRASTSQPTSPSFLTSEEGLAWLPLRQGLYACPAHPAPPVCGLALTLPGSWSPTATPCGRCSLFSLNCKVCGPERF